MHIFVEHPETGKCIVCLFNISSDHVFVSLPTHPVKELYQQKICNKVENLLSEKTITKCETCE